MREYKVLHLFAGIGGGALGFERARAEAAGLSGQDLVARLRHEAALADVPREEPHASHARRLREMADRIEAAGKEGAGG